MSKRESFLLRLDPAILAALKQWAEAELRSTNAQIDFLLRESLRKADRLPKAAGPEMRDDSASDNTSDDIPASSDGNHAADSSDNC